MDGMRIGHAKSFYEGQIFHVSRNGNPVGFLKAPRCAPRVGQEKERVATKPALGMTAVISVTAVANHRPDQSRSPY